MNFISVSIPHVCGVRVTLHNVIIVCSVLCQSLGIDRPVFIYRLMGVQDASLIDNLVPTVNNSGEESIQQSKGSLEMILSKSKGFHHTFQLFT